MFRAWNYTIELFFWIILGAVILVSLTIFLARPRFRSKGSETSEEALSLTGESVDSPEGSILDQDATSDRVEEEFEILEEIEKGETAWTRLGRWVGNILRLLRKEWMTVVTYTSVCYSLCVCGLGALIVFDEIYFRATSNTSLVNSFRELILGITIIFIGLLSLYGFLMKNQKWLRIYSCRDTAILFLPVAILNIDPVQEDLIGFAIIPLLFSGDLKRLWERILSNERVKAPIVSILDTRLLLFSVILLLTIIVVFF